MESQKRLASEVKQAANYVKSLLPEKLKKGDIRTDWRFVPSAELGGGVAPPLAIVFTDGSTWDLEVPRPSKSHAQSVVELLSQQL